MPPASPRTRSSPGENYVNHVGIAYDNFDEAFAFYTQKMGFREAFTVKDAQGKPTLAYMQANRNTFVEIQQANANRPKGLNHYGLHVQDLKATVAALKQRGVTVTEPNVRPDDSSVANATDPRRHPHRNVRIGPGLAGGQGDRQLEIRTHRVRS